jgi:endonuclease/exonuclease/phosphatase family metal-dependent hydrolase
MTQVRMMTYNIFMGGRKGSALHEVVRAVAPDVITANETPKQWLVWKHRCQHLAELWGMRFVVGGRPAGSNMIAVAGDVVVKTARAEVLKQPLFQPRRGIAWAQLRIEGRLFGVVCCHLSLDRKRRLQEVERVIELAERLRGPVIVAGDLNESPAGQSWQRLEQAGFVDHGSKAWPTFPADQPNRRIDALLVRGPVQVLHHGDPDVPPELLAAASDHRPVLSVLEFS